MLARLIDRMPALLLLASLALAAQVALVHAGDPAGLLACVPAALLLVLYLRDGRRSRRARP